MTARLTHRLLAWAIAALGFVCFPTAAYPVDPYRMISQYSRDRWGDNKGFPGRSVTAIAQTNDGYLWIGTEKGLVRFDGLNFRLFRQATPESFPIGSVQDLVTDAEANLWILLQGTKILRFHDGKFELGREQAELGVTAIGRRRNGSILLSSLASGILTYSGKKFEILRSPTAEPPTSAAIAAAQTNDELSSRFSWSTTVAAHRLAEPNSAVVSVKEASDGKLWLATRDGGLFYMSDGRVSAVAKGEPGRKINCLLALENGQLWVGTEKGLIEWNGRELTQTEVPTSLLHVEVLTMIRDRDSNIWVGTARGILRFNANGVSPAAREVPTTDGPVTALFEDREGNIWVGGPRGLERLRDSAFVSHSIAGLKSQSMGPLYVDSDEKTWFAPIEGGLRWLKGGKIGVVTAGGLSHDIVYSITGNGKSDLWVGRQRGGLTHVRYMQGALTVKTYTQADGLAQNSVYAVYESGDGTVWSGMLNGGVSELRNGHFTNYTTANGLASNTVSSIAEGADGTMWFGTPNGLSAMVKNGWRTYTVGDGLPSEDVNCLLPDSTGVLWIGTAGGLAFLGAGHIQVPRAVPDLLQEPIFGIVEDGNGWLWVATASHVLQVKYSSLMGSVLTESDVREYGLEDGLQGTEGVKRYRSVVTDSQGSIWFSTNRGLSVVNPKRTTVNSVPALVHIEAVLGDGSPFDLQGPLRVSGAKQMTFRYAGLSLSNSERVRYRYRLDGFDHTWGEAVRNPEATYGNLRAGTYRFRVKASNSDGLWNSSEALVEFVVEPTLWQTWWFWLLCVATFLALLLAAYRLRLRQLAREFNMRLDERVMERSRIARELHDTLLQNVQGLILKIHAIAKRIPTADPTRQDIEKALDFADQVLAEGRDRVRNLRASTLGFGELPKAFQQVVEEAAPNRSSTFKTVIEGTVLELHPIIREETYSIGREALINALTHSEAHNIEVEIIYESREFRLRIRDDGRGVDPGVLEKGGRENHWGLQGMRERANRIGAKLELWSRQGSGTEVELRVPAATAYRSPGGKTANSRPRLPAVG